MTDTTTPEGRAIRRGERLENLTNRIATGLFQHPPCISLDRSAWLGIFHVLADDLYGNQPITLPTQKGDLT